ncbi:unnamed protein product, partial [Ilex paraguariensis]
DLLIFGRANVNEASAISRVVSTFEEWSRQQINRDKSISFYSPNQYTQQQNQGSKKPDWP